MKPYIKLGVTIQTQLRYKYLLSIEGNDVASGLKWQLLSNSVVFMTPPKTVSWAMEYLLIPWVHYIPLVDDYSDVIDKIEWAKANDREAELIAKRSTRFMKDLMDQNKQAQVKRRLIELYHERFNAVIHNFTCPD